MTPKPDSPDPDAPLLRLGLPKGRMQAGVQTLLADAGIQVREGVRSYRPSLNLPGWEVKLLKPQNIVEMLHAGSRDIGFAGADWVAELGADLIELLDTGLDPVRLVAAAPEDLLDSGRIPDRPLRVASEYERLATAWIRRRRISATLIRSYGATEAFPPEDADLIVDNTATGATLEANGLGIVDELMASTTRLYAAPGVWRDPARREAIEGWVLLLRSVLDARRRVLLDVNVPAEQLEALCAVLPCMREPTISPLHGSAGFAVKAAVLRAELPALIPRIRARGGTDIVVTAPQQIVP